MKFMSDLLSFDGTNFVFYGFNFRLFCKRNQKKFHNFADI